jgi:dihydrolipoamide dehydrogenase
VTDRFDVVVIGGGPGGYVAAIRATQLGAATALIEKARIGGTCLNKGCIPTKALLQGASFLDQLEYARQFGISCDEVEIDFGRLQARKDEIVSSLRNDLSGLLADDGVEVIEGIAQLQSATRVQVTQGDRGTRALEAEKIVIATGSVPFRPRIPGVDSPLVLTSDEALELRDLPSSLVIVGGGVIGVEFATIFARLGANVTIVEMMPQILPGEDTEVAAALAKTLGKLGIEMLVSAKVSEIRSVVNSEARVIVEVNGSQRELIGERVLMAVGRRPLTDGLRLEELGVKLSSSAIVVNRQMETSLPGVYAIGDVVGGLMLAHVASREGIVAVENALGHQASMDYRAIPRCIYTLPEVAAVGIDERKAADEGYNVTVGRFGFLANGRAKITGETDGIAKVVVDKDYGEVLGVHIFGPHATELIGPAVLAIQAELSAELVRSAIAPHPTLSETLAEAFDDAFGQAIHIPKWMK